MTDGVRLAIVHPGATPLLERVIQAARSNGWRVIDPSSTTADETIDNAPTLILTRHPDQAAAWAPTHYLVSGAPDGRGLAKDRLLALSEIAADLDGWARVHGIAGLDLRAHELPGLGAIVSEGTINPSPDDPLALYASLPVSTGARAVWLPHLFNYPIKGEPEGGSPAMDLTGRFRNLVNGPHLTVPAGVWALDFEVAVDPERGTVPLRFEWGPAGAPSVAINTRISRAGLYGMTLIHRWAQPAPADMRLWLFHPVFQGRLEFIKATVRRLTDETEISPPEAEAGA